MTRSVRLARAIAAEVERTKPDEPDEPWTSEAAKKALQQSPVVIYTPGWERMTVARQEQEDMLRTLRERFSIGPHRAADEGLSEAVLQEIVKCLYPCKNPECITRQYLSRREFDRPNNHGFVRVVIETAIRDFVRVHKAVPEVIEIRPHLHLPAETK